MALKTVTRVGVEDAMRVVVRDVIEVVLMADLAHLGTRVVVSECFRSDRRFLRAERSGQEEQRHNPGYPKVAATMRMGVDHLKATVARQPREAGAATRYGISRWYGRWQPRTEA